ncbi:MAG: hypothetical protein JWN39_91, partial [Ilumatobacteraceae bacterium]|nr:hypothetical protein [Ilumatobacteraceae bacterium]
TIMQFAFLVATIAVVRRLIGGIGGLLTAVAGAVLVCSMGPAVFLEPWNPWGGVFSFFCFIALCWGIACGRHRWLPAAAFCGFFAVQCHAGYALLVSAALAAMVVLLAVRWRRGPRDGLMRSWWIAVAVTVVMWTPPIIDQLRRDPGNLRILWRHFTSSTEADGTPRAFVGIGAALKAFAGELSLPGPWLRGDFRQPTAAPNIIGLVLAVAIIGFTVRLLLIQREGDHRDMLLRLFVVLGGLTAVGIVSTSRVFGEFYDYVIRWWWLIVAWMFLGCALVLVRRLEAKSVVVGALVVGALMSGLATAHALGRQNPGERNGRIVGGIDALIRPRLVKGDHYLLRWDDPLTLGGVAFGMVLDLEKHGYHLGVDSADAAGALPHRVLPEANADAVLWVVLGDANIEQFRARTGVTELGYFDPRSASEKVRSDALRQSIIDQLGALGKSCLAPKIDEQYGLSAIVLGSSSVPTSVVSTAGKYYDLGLPAAVFQLAPFAPLPTAAPSTC